MAVRAGARPRPRRGWTRGAPVAALLLALVAGCGAPEYTYVTNSDDRTYVKVPSSWRQLDERQLTTAMGFDAPVSGQDDGLWVEGYDADAAPSADHLVGEHAEAPVAFVSVQQVPTEARGGLSLDWLRVYPVMLVSREMSGQEPMSAFSDLQVQSDQVLTPGDGLRGVHVVYRVRLADGPPQVIDQTAYLNDDASKVYMLLVRCSTECYDQRQREISNVVSSFTVRESP